MSTTDLTPDFTPERSAAIRQLLIDTVADEPRRRRRLQILLTSVLSGVALVLAGGTAALALSGALHFGGDDVPAPPAPTPTPSITPTPTATPTPAPTATARPLVQSAPVLPHDVDSLRPTTRWSLDLPGDPECTGATAYTLSDARAVYVSGLRPKEYEGSDCINHLAEDIGVTLVDTSDGTVLWQREWRFTPKEIGFGTGFEVLGTSGRGVLAFGNAADGPHEVLDLTTGRTVGAFAQPDWPRFRPNRDMRAVPGDSGDLILLKHDEDADGRPTGTDTVYRVDPSHADDPEWSRTVPLTYADLGFTAREGTVITLHGGDASTGHETSMLLDLDTGETTSIRAQQPTPMSQALVGEARDPQGGPMQVIAYGPDGGKLWTHVTSPSASVFAATTPDTVPAVVNGFQQGDTGELFVADTDLITLLDQSTGEARWSVPTSRCFPAGFQPYDAVLDVGRDAFVLVAGDTRCALSHETGALVEAPTLPLQNYTVYGLTHAYTFSGADDPGVAYDLGSGAKIWSRERHDWEGWRFDGGYLVSHRLNHIESIG